MTIEEAAGAIGRTVIYRARTPRAEEGVIASVNAHWVFVRYGSDQNAKATTPSMLELAATS